MPETQWISALCTFYTSITNDKLTILGNFRFPTNLKIMEYRSSSMQVLYGAERENEQLGHTNLGYLSSSHGFMPKNEPLKHLPSAFSLWDTISHKTPVLIKELLFRQELDEMSVLLPTAQNLPDKFLARASILLGFFAHAYVNCAGPLVTQADVPDSIMTPWRIVCNRLGRPEPFLSYFDLIAYNWQFKNENNSERTLENMELLYPIFNCKEERNLYLIQTEMMASASPMVQAAAEAQEAASNNDHVALSNALDVMIACLKKVTHVSFAKLAYLKSKKNHLDPVVFTKTMMSFAVPIKEGIPGPSGTSFPYAHLIDTFIGRKKYDEGISHEALKIRSLYPPAVKRFLEAIASVSIADYIADSNSEELKNKYIELIDSYSGDNGFLNIHRKRVYSFIQTSFKVGRPQTIGGFNADNDEEWNNVNDALRNMRKERPKCPFAHKQKTTPTEKIPRKELNGDEVSLSNLATHSSSKTGYWVEIDNKVLDITKFISKHKGGDDTLLEYVGSSITTEYGRIHSDSAIAHKVVEKLSIGKLVEPKFKNESLNSLWNEQKQLLHSIIELNNIYNLEIAIASKKCFENDDPHSSYPFKDFLRSHSNSRIETIYKAKLEKSAQKISNWITQHEPDWNKQCPIKKIKRKVKSIRNRWPLAKVIEEKNRLSLEEIKTKAIQLTKILEDTPLNIDKPPLEIKPLAKTILAAISSLNSSTDDIYDRLLSQEIAQRF